MKSMSQKNRSVKNELDMEPRKHNRKAQRQNPVNIYKDMQKAQSIKNNSNLDWRRATDNESKVLRKKKKKGIIQKLFWHVADMMIQLEKNAENTEQMTI